MNATELRATAGLAAVFAVRLLGLFMVYPVFAHYAQQLRGANSLMIGLALGGYGLAQGVLQIPLGALSDRIGRKTVISIGLLLFAAGSVVAARANTIEVVLVGRILQGMGAVGSSILALVGDLTRVEVRTRAMAVVGVTIGLSFGLAILIGPLVAAATGLSGIFWMTALLAIAGIAITLAVVPTPSDSASRVRIEPTRALFMRVLRSPELLRLDFAIFTLHAVLTAGFLVIPGILANAFHLGAAGQWKLYLPVMAASMALMVPAVIVAETRGRMKEVFIAAILAIGLSLLGLALSRAEPIAAVIALTAFFTAFNIMEAMLPSLVTKMAPAGARGAATGVYSSSQFFGIFVGGAGGGLLLATVGPANLLMAVTDLVLVWFAIALGMGRPDHYGRQIISLRGFAPEQILAATSRLATAAGVVEAVAAVEEEVVYLTIDRDNFDQHAAERIAAITNPELR
jgi:predicted MFS family arabinose efflux permease